VFFPLSAGFQDRKVRLYLSLIGVMGLVGLWHGAGWGYILWGIMHGVYLVIYRALEGSGEIERRNWIARMGWRIFTLVAVTAAWVPFRSVSLGQAKMMWSSMFFHFSFGMSYSINFYLVTLLCCVLCLVEPYCGRVIRKGESLAENIGSGMRVNAYVLKPIVYACLLLMFLIFDDRDVQFIYFQF
jgi:alginate O-acetyltransferase complex protein AlgI